MAGPESKTSARNIIARKREAEAIELRLAGGTYDQIAQAIGYESRASAYRAVVRGLQSLSKVQDVEHLRELELERLDRLFLGVWSKAVKGDDHKIDRVLKIMVRRAKLLGLDAPVRQELAGPGEGRSNMTTAPSPSLTARSDGSWEKWPLKKKMLLESRLKDRLATASPKGSTLPGWCLAHRLIDGRPFSFVRHEYLKDIYADPAPSLVLRKAAQMGASEYAITRALHFAIGQGGRTIYFFPTDNDVGEFSRDRFAPAVAQSDYLRHLVRNTDTAGLKQIGKGSVYFRGTRSRTRMKSVPADFLIFDELDEMVPANVVLAEERLGHSDFGFIVKLSTPSLPEYGIDAAFQATDQRHWLLKCPGCGRWRCLEDEFVEHHGSPADPRLEICFIQGEPGEERLVCLDCGAALDPAVGNWVPKQPGRPRGYHLSSFVGQILSQKEKEHGYLTKPAALLAQWRATDFPEEFFNSKVGLPYLAAEGGLTEQDLLALEGRYGQTDTGLGCVMGVDQGNGLHVVVKEPTESGIVLTIRVHHEPQTDATFTHLDHLMQAYDVRACVIDAMPNTHAARSFARRFPGRVWLCWYSRQQKGAAAWGKDQEHTPIVNVNRTEALDAWRDAHKLAKRRIPRLSGDVREYIKQMTNMLRKVEEDPVSGEKTARWIKRGPDHFAHADNYAEIALGRVGGRNVQAKVLG